MENFRNSAHNSLKGSFENIELTVAIVNESYIPDPQGPDDPINWAEDLELYRMERKVIKLHIDGQLRGEYFEDLEDLREDLINEITLNIEYKPNERRIPDYLKKLKDEYSNILDKIVPNRKGNLSYDNPSISNKLLSSEQPKEILREIPYLFGQQNLKLRKIINHISKQIDENQPQQDTGEKNNKGYSMLTWNGNINQLVDIFYRLSREKKYQDKFYIETTKENLINFLCSSFIDKEGHKLSSSSIETILRPGKTDKRPSHNKQIDLDTSLNSPKS